MDSQTIIRRLKEEGWLEVHVAGSHHKFKHPDKPGHVVVPHPKRNLPQGTARNIFRQAGWPWRNR
jgi:predicted RNA binding protein YcfA (HicA-like mRNA interferase family)